MAPEDITRSEQERQGPPTIRQQLADALDSMIVGFTALGKAVEKRHGPPPADFHRRVVGAQVAIDRHRAELERMAEQTVCEQLVEEALGDFDRWQDEHMAADPGKVPACLGRGCPSCKLARANLRAALDRARKEPEKPHVCHFDGDYSDCSCYQEGRNEGHSSGCNDDSCACWEAGHADGLEAQRERMA